MSEANEREDDAVPDEDPRQTGVADQMPEENPEGQGAGGAERQRRDTDDRGRARHVARRRAGGRPREGDGQPARGGLRGAVRADGSERRGPRVPRGTSAAPSVMRLRPTPRA